MSINKEFYTKTCVKCGFKYEKKHFCNGTAARYEEMYRGENLYIAIDIGEDGNLAEFSLSSCDMDKADQPLTLAGQDCVAKLINTHFEYEVPIQRTLRDLDEASRGRSDLPGVIARTLRRYLKEIHNIEL